MKLKNPLYETLLNIQTIYELTVLYSYGAIEQEEKYIEILKIYNEKIKENIKQYEQKTGKKI